MKLLSEIDGKRAPIHRANAMALQQIAPARRSVRYKNKTDDANH